MFNLVLAFVACLGAQTPDQARQRCQLVELPFDGSPMQCAMFGQAQMASWMRDHQGWRPRHGWRCERGREV